MAKKIESTAEIEITVEMFEDGRAQVRMKTLDAEFVHLLNATKYMMWIVSKKSGLELEEALEILCEGARNFKGVSLSLVPKKKEDQS